MTEQPGQGSSGPKMTLTRKETKMRYWLDTEFIERPCTIDLISIGIVAEDGRELYAESTDVDWTQANQWVLENVRPHLTGSAMPRDDIRDNVLRFIGADESPEFWGYYADYDWVVFCWLFGAMIDLPDGWPMFCRDIKQYALEHFPPDLALPQQVDGEHNALSDARWNRKTHRWLDGEDFDPESVPEKLTPTSTEPARNR